jgi:phosphoglycerate dehydrogenase-like enzyme
MLFIIIPQCAILDNMSEAESLSKTEAKIKDFWIRVIDHEDELINNINNDGASHIGRDPEFSITVAELVIGLMIMSMRGLNNFVIDQANRVWNHRQYQTIHKKRIAIIGNGSTSTKVKQFIKNLYPLSEVYSFSKHGQNNSFTMDKFDALLPKIDIIVILIPSNDETKNLFNADRIKNMKDGSLLINASKGNVLDQEELIKHLYAKRIYAAVDQTDPIVLPTEHPLWDAPNFIMTPHIGINAR